MHTTTPSYDFLIIGGGVFGITVDVAEGKFNRWAERFKWQHLDATTVQKEEAPHHS